MKICLVSVLFVVKLCDFLDRKRKSWELPGFKMIIVWLSELHCRWFGFLGVKWKRYIESLYFIFEVFLCVGSRMVVVSFFVEVLLRLGFDLLLHRKYAKAWDVNALWNINQFIVK